MKRLGRFFRAVKTCCHDERGSFAVKTALLSPLLILATGVVLDYSRMGSAASDLQDAADTAAISAAAALMREDKKWKKNSEALLDSNAVNHPDLDVKKVKITKGNETTVRVEARAKLDAMFPQIMGYPKYDIVRVSEATYGTPERLELAIVLDTTNSMANSGAWSDAVKTLEALLEDMKAMTGQSNFFVTLIPFQNRVNVGSHRTSWIPGSKTAGWKGCVNPREEVIGTFNWAVDDDVFTSEPFELATFPNSSGKIAHYDCKVAPIAGPTNNPAIIAASAKSLNIDQSGRFDQALAWGWRAVSPKWKGQWGQSNYPADYGDSRKVIVMMTDWRSTVYSKEVSKEEDLGWNNGSTVGLQHYVDLCDRVKAAGVEIFIVRLPGNDHAPPYMKQCASSLSHYLEANAADDLPKMIGSIRDAMSDEVRLIR